MRVVNGYAALWAPPLDDSSQVHLFRIIGNVWTQAVDCATKMSVTIADNLGARHSRFEGEKDGVERAVKELSSEFPKLRVLSMFAIG